MGAVSIIETVNADVNNILGEADGSTLDQFEMVGGCLFIVNLHYMRSVYLCFP